VLRSQQSTSKTRKPPADILRQVLADFDPVKAEVATCMRRRPIQALSTVKAAK